MTKNSYNIYEEPFILNVYPSNNRSEKQVFILLHGWTGNENSMSVFLQAIPDSAVAIAPRGNYEVSENSFGWANATIAEKHDFSAFKRTAEKLHTAIKAIVPQLTNSSNPKFNLIGFSQGAALSLVYSLIFPQDVDKVAILSGFLPSFSPLPASNHSKVPTYYIAHGKQDPLVEYQRALEVKNYLEQLSASITFCSADIGHRVSAECLAALKAFFDNNYRE